MWISHKGPARDCQTETVDPVVMRYPANIHEAQMSRRGIPYCKMLTLNMTPRERRFIWILCGLIAALFLVIFSGALGYVFDP